MPLTDNEREEIRRLVKMSTEEAISQTFRVMGVNTSNYDHLREFRENHEWVKKYRKTAERIGSHVIISITTILTGGILAAIWAYVTKR